ncbi:Acylglycerol kinase [Sarcoptes scabiei]|nr:Acylglycerol kinase [Sarcoptes scabiei]
MRVRLCVCDLVHLVFSLWTILYTDFFFSLFGFSSKHSMIFFWSSFSYSNRCSIFIHNHCFEIRNVSLSCFQPYHPTWICLLRKKNLLVPGKKIYTFWISDHEMFWLLRFSSFSWKKTKEEREKKGIKIQKNRSEKFSFRFFLLHCLKHFSHFFFLPSKTKLS